jgi:Amt family ammonium transporter
MIGASLLWVGWFGFNAGSNLEARQPRRWPSSTPWWPPPPRRCPGAGRVDGQGQGRRCWALPPARWPAWWRSPRPAASSARWAPSIIGLVAGVVCLWGVNGLKRMLGADDSLDVFGVHGVGGILGALLTGVFAAPSLGGVGWSRLGRRCRAAYSIGGQVWIQLKAVFVTIVWSAWSRSSPSRSSTWWSACAWPKTKSAKAWTSLARRDGLPSLICLRLLADPEAASATRWR